MLRTLLRPLKPLLPKSLELKQALYGPNSALRKAGWFRSAEEGHCVDAGGQAVPWFTYPSIEFLGPRIPATAQVFEFGMGNSTLWWARHAQHVATCEGDKGWLDRISKVMPGNVETIYADPASDDYPAAARNRGKPIDILVIDGRRRVDSCVMSLPQLSRQGVVVWDNAERERYSPGFDALAEAGFKRLDFWGLGPLHVQRWVTSVFYRPDNILGI